MKLTIKQYHYLHRVPGFTIFETIVAMVLTGLLSLLVFSGIQYYHRLFINIQKTGQTQTDIKLLQQALQNDVFRAKSVYYDDGIICSSSLGEIGYSFIDGAIIRTTDIGTDTFKINYQPPIINFSPISEQLVGEIVIICSNNELQFSVSAIKEYPQSLLTEID